MAVLVAYMRVRYTPVYTRLVIIDTFSHNYPFNQVTWDWILQIELEEKEHLVCISGYYGKTEGTEDVEAIKSLTFFTNKSKFEPIDAEVGKYLSTAYCYSISGEVVGFFSHFSSYLDAIGVDMRYF